MAALALSEDFTLREYKPEDYSGLMDLWALTGLGGPERDDNEDVIEKTLQGGGKLFLLFEGSGHKLIGSSWITNDSRRLYLHHFAIHPQYQGQKLSTILMKASLSFAQDMQMQIKLEVHQSNKKAINIYTQYGFSYLGDYDVYIIRDY